MTGVDPSLARDLDEQARSLDLLALAGDALSVARAHIRRRMLLSDLAAAGLPDDCATDLERAGFVCLAGYVRASRERAAFLDEHPGTDIDVSLDWFRLGSPTPPGIDPHTWLARWLAILGAEPLGPGVAGHTIVREDGVWYRVEWRRDDGERPAILRVGPVA